MDFKASFRLFYLRIRSRIKGCTDWLVQLVLALGGQIKEADVDRVQSRGAKGHWSWFVVLASEYVRLYSRLPSTEVIARRYLWQHIYAVLSRKRMGLGP